MPLPNESATAGTGFILTGATIAIIGLFVFVIELFNSASMGPMTIGISGMITGLMLMTVGYVKRASVAAAESYQLQKRIYEETHAASSAEQA